MRSTSTQALARSVIYELLSLAFLYPEPATNQVLRESAPRLARLASELDWPRRARVLERLAHATSHLDAERLRCDHTAVFGHTVSPDCPPYGADYGQAHIFQLAQAMADIVAFYRAFGVQPNPALKDRPDHVSVELEFMHVLAMKEAYALAHGHGEDRVRQCREAQEAFLARHLAPWIKTFAARLVKKAPDGSIYRHVGDLLDAHVTAELEAFRLHSAPVLPMAVAAGGDSGPDCDACLSGAGAPAEGGLS